MGYTTDFEGQFTFSRKLTDEQTEFIQQFSESRRMGRDVNELMRIYEGRGGLPLPQTSIGEDTRTPEEIYGVDGEFFVGGEDRATVKNYNVPPITQPGLWCQWTTDDGETLVWDGNEKFHNYVTWMEYLIENIFKKWGIVLNGSVNWVGEDSSDLGQLIVTDNVVTTREGEVIYK